MIDPIDRAETQACSPSKPSRAAERGQGLVEFALVLPLLLVLILAIVEFALVILDYNTVSSAAREGARYGVVHPETTADGNCAAPGLNSILAAACKVTKGLEPANITVERLACTGITLKGCVSIRVTYQAQLLTAPIIAMFGGSPTVTLGSTARMGREQ